MTSSKVKLSKVNALLISICLLAFLIRLTYAVYSGPLNDMPKPGSDESEYELYAWNMATGNGYTGFSAANPTKERPTSLRAPLPSIIYAGVYKIVGRKPAALHLLNMLIDSINVLMIFLLGKRLFGTIAGLVAGAIWCIYPMAVFLSTRILSESMAIALICSHVLLLSSFQKDRKWHTLIGAGLILGLLLLTKPEFILYLPLLVAWSIFMYWQAPVTALKCSIMVPLIAAVIVLPWTYRNYHVHGELIPVATGGGETLMQGNNDYVVPGTPVSDPSLYGYNVRSWGLPEYREMFEGMNEVERDRAAQKEALRWLSENKNRWLWLAWAKTKRQWTPFMQPHAPAAQRYAMLFSYGPILALAIPAFILTLLTGCRRKLSLTILHVLLLLVQIKAVLFFGFARYRFLAVPALILMAAVSITWIIHSFFPWRFGLSGEIESSGSFDLNPPSSPRSKEKAHKLSVIMPVYNEEDTVVDVIDKVLSASLHREMEMELVVVDDGSTDGTRKLIKTHPSKDRFQYIEHRKNRGKGSALRTGFKYASGDIILVQDADLEYDTGDYGKLVNPILQGSSLVVYGSRILGERTNPKGRPLFYLGGRFLSFLTNVLYGTSISDEPTCYKVFDSATLKSIPLQCERFEFCPEVTARLAKMGVNIHEVPIAYTPRHKAEGKKITWHDGLQAIWTLLRMRVTGKHKHTSYCIMRKIQIGDTPPESQDRQK